MTKHLSTLNATAPPCQVVPLFGHLFEQGLHGGDAVVILFRPQQVLLSLSQQFVDLVTKLQPRVAQTAYLGMLR